MSNRANTVITEIDENIRFRVTESYKAIRTNLVLSIIKQGCKTVVVSSSLPGEGKSTASVNLAISLAQTEAKVLLIDCDLRKSRVHRFFKFQISPGLTNLLGDMATVEEAVQSTGYPNLQVICAGMKAPNPSELLASEQMAGLLRGFSERYDYIILDSPPINVVSDALPLIKLSDGVVMVVRENTTTFPTVTAALKNLELVDAKILGFVVNGVKENGGKYSNYKYKYKYD